MKNTKKILVIALGALLITGCVKTPKLENGEEILASIDGKDYTVSELYTKMKETYGTSTLVDMVDEFIISKELTNTASEEAQAKSYVAQLKNYYESNGSNWAQVLQQNGLTEESLLKQYTVNYEKETVAKNYYKSIITDKEVDKYYKDEIIGDITAKQILIVPETTTSMTDAEKAEANTKAYNKALEVIQKLNNGEDFSELAKTYSDDDSKDVGGTLAPFNKQSNYPEDFINQAIKLNVGEYSKSPIKTTYGYHIISIVSKEDKPSLEDTKETIINTIAEKNIKDNENYMYTAWKAIREKYNFTINDTIVNEKYDQAMSQY